MFCLAPITILLSLSWVHWLPQNASLHKLRSRWKSHFKMYKNYSCRIPFRVRLRTFFYQYLYTHTHTHTHTLNPSLNKTISSFLFNFFIEPSMFNVIIWIIKSLFVLFQVAPLVKWLKEAEEESSDDDWVQQAEDHNTTSSMTLWMNVKITKSSAARCSNVD